MSTKEDAKILAGAVTTLAFDTDVERGRNAYNECRLCGGAVYHDESYLKIEHAPDCPYLTAKRVLEVKP